MRILLDHNTPAPLRYWLLGHQVETAYERGWSELTNGDLLRMAKEAGFDAMITTDKGIRYQQNACAGRDQYERLDANSEVEIRCRERDLGRPSGIFG